MSRGPRSSRPDHFLLSSCPMRAKCASNASIWIRSLLPSVSRKSVSPIRSSSRTFDSSGMLRSKTVRCSWRMTSSPESPYSIRRRSRTSRARRNSPSSAFSISFLTSSGRIVLDTLYRASPSIVEPPRRVLIRSEFGGRVEEDDLKARPAERREPGDLLDFRPDRLDAALVAAVQLVIVLPPVLSEHISREGDGARRLAGARRAREEQVGQVPLLRVGLEALDDFLLSHDLVEGLRAILLDPDFLHRRPNTRRIRRMRNKPLAWRSKNLSERDLEEVRNRRDRIDQRRRGTSGEEKSHGVTAFVDDERPAVSTLRDEVAHDLFAEHGRLAAVVHLDGRIECGDATPRDPARAPALPNAHPELCVPGTGDAADPENVPRHGSRVDRLRDRGIDEVHLAGREAFDAQAGPCKERREKPAQRPEPSIVKLDRHEVDEPRDRVLEAPAVRGAGLQDRISDARGVLVREDVVVRQDHRPSTPAGEDAQGACGNLEVSDAHAARRGPDPFGPVHIGCLRRPQRVEPPGLDDVRPDSAECLRDDIAVPQLRLRPFRLDEDDDARLLRLAAADHFVPDRHADHVRASEDRGLVRDLHGPHAVPRHASPLPLERTDLEEAFSELPAGRRPRDPDHHVRDEPQEDPDPIIG